VTNVEVTGRVKGQGYVPPPPHKAKLFIEKIYTRGAKGDPPSPTGGLAPAKKYVIFRYN